MKHEHMNVNDEVEQTGPKKPWVTPRLDDLDRKVTDSGGEVTVDGPTDAEGYDSPALS